MRLTAFAAAALSITGFCFQASASAADAPVPAPVANAVPDPVDVVIETGPRPAMSFSQRLDWFGSQSFGIRSFIGLLPGAALNTGIDYPKEAGPHWSGLGERYGVSFSTNVISNAIEASVGAIWGEDPRYSRSKEGTRFAGRLGHVMKWTVMAPNRQGELRPAYARYIAFSSSSFITDAWREPSDTTADAAVSRIGLAFVGRAGSNAWDEFWPDVKRKVFHRATKD
ncbi:MAG TPA: hypothetical protein VG273_04145 [Bryobacteraceae bacterium]|nr:hypothetical protein [Bryobacteraceae bacterium]